MIDWAQSTNWHLLKLIKRTGQQINLFTVAELSFSWKNKTSKLPHRCFILHSLRARPRYDSSVVGGWLLGVLVCQECSQFWLIQQAIGCHCVVLCLIVSHGKLVFDWKTFGGVKSFNTCKNSSQNFFFGKQCMYIKKFLMNIIIHHRRGIFA